MASINIGPTKQFGTYTFKDIVVGQYFFRNGRLCLRTKPGYDEHNIFDFDKNYMATITSENYVCVPCWNVILNYQLDE
jgi:hypothetical protein